MVPKQRPKKRYSPMEIHDEERRAMASEGLLKLWEAMDLSRDGGGIRSPDKKDAYYRAYRYLGEMLLGKDCPEKEMLT